MSSFINEVRKVSSDTIEISMLSNRVYRYTGIDNVDEVMNDFLEAESQGRYYNQNIKGQYICIEVSEEITEHTDSVDTVLNADEVLINLKSGRIITFGTKEELEELLSVVSLDYDIHIHSLKLLTGYDYYSNMIGYDGILLVDGILQLVTSETYEDAKKITFSALSSIRKRVTSSEIMRLEMTINKKDNESSPKEDNEDKSNYAAPKTLSELLELKNKTNKALETIINALSSGLVSIDMLSKIDDIKAYIALLEGEKSI